MSADDQAFLDVLSSLPHDIQKRGIEVAEYIDKNVDKVADAVRDVLASSTWLPESVRPLIRSPSPAPLLSLPTSTYERMQSWLQRHKILTGFIVLATGTVLYRTYRTSAICRKTRRAKRARSGGRLEVVVIAGSPALPLTKSLALDLERKGFVVFIVSNSPEDDALIQSLARVDIRALAIDTTDPPSAGNSIERFAQYLQSPHAAIPQGKRHHLTLNAVIIIPSLNYQTSPIATIPPSSFADLFNTHLLHPILTTQAFLPLLTARLGPATQPAAEDKRSGSKVIVFTPSIISSINPPFHAPEATVCSALSAFTEVLTAELRPLGIPVTHIQLGAFDFSGFTPATGATRSGQYQQQALPPSDGGNPLTWPDGARQVYGQNFMNQHTSLIGSGRIRGMRGSSLRDLHNAVFDVIDGSNTSGTVRIGLGASVYGFVGRWVPRSLVEWMMGIRKVDELATWQTSSNSSAMGSPKLARRDSGETGHESFITVPLEHGSDTHVWKEGM